MLTLVFSLLFLTACPKDAEKKGAGGANPDRTIIIDLPDKDYGKYEFKILTHSFAYLDFEAEDITGDMMKDAIYNRNTRIEEQFNIVLKHTFESGLDRAEFQKKVTASNLAGDNAYDLIAADTYVLIPLGNTKQLIDWHKLPYVDLARPWWDKNVVRDICFGNKIFYMAGDINYTTLSHTGLVIFNKKLFDDAGFEYPYQLVRDGKWTIDEMMRYMRGYTKDLNGDGKLTWDHDRFGFCGWYLAIGNNYLYGLGGRVVGKDDKGMPALAINQPRTVDLIDKIYEMFWDCESYLNTVDWGYDLKVFQESRALFADSRMVLLPNMRTMENDFGILPIPKLRAEDEYSALVDNVGTQMGVPTTAPDLERTSIILEAMAYDSYYSIIPTYYDVILQTRDTRDDDSAEMLDIIRAAKCYPYPGFQDPGMNDIVRTVVITDKSKNFASFIARRESAAKLDLNKLAKQIQDNK